MAIGFRRAGNRGGGEDERPDPASMTLVEHLTELRRRVIIAFSAVGLGAVAGFFLYDPVLEILIDPYTDATGRTTLLITDPLEAFSIRLKLSMYIGLLVASPVVLWQLWRFVTPGLHDNEKRYAVPFIVSSIVLFLVGAALALWTFPKTLEFFEAFAGDNTETFYTPGKYLGLLTLMMLAFGIGFEFPVLLTFLQAARVLTWRRLVAWRRYAIIIVFLVDAVITPSGDPITLLALAVPMCVFYEVSILLGRFVLDRR